MRRSQVLHRWWLNTRPGLHLDAGAEVYLGARLSTEGGGSIRLSRGCIVHSGAVLLSSGGELSVGAGSTVNPFCVLDGRDGLSIGRDVRIAAHTVIAPDDPSFAPAGRGVSVEDDVWIGANCTILDGASIGTGCVVGAGSVVASRLEPRGVYVGRPARLIRRR